MISTFGCSPLLESVLDESHSEIDYSLTNNNQVFHQLLYMVDGIYLWFARFLSAFAVSTTGMDSNNLRWQ